MNPFTKAERAANYAAVVARNHARLAALADKQTADLGMVEDLTLVGQVVGAAPVRTVREVAAESAQMGLFNLEGAQ